MSCLTLLRSDPLKIEDLSHRHCLVCLAQAGAVSRGGSNAGTGDRDDEAKHLLQLEGVSQWKAGAASAGIRFHQISMKE